MKNRLTKTIGALVLGLGLTYGCSYPKILDNPECKGVVFEYPESYDSFIPEEGLVGSAHKNNNEIDFITKNGKPLRQSVDCRDYKTDEDYLNNNMKQYKEWKEANKELKDNLECNLQKQ